MLVVANDVGFGQAFPCLVQPIGGRILNSDRHSLTEAGRHIFQPFQSLCYEVSSLSTGEKER